MAGRSPTVRVLENPGELALAGAEEVRRRAAEAVAARGTFRIVLAGGTTPRALYEELARRRGDGDFARWDFWFGDERCVPPDHPDSNFRMASRALLSPIGAAAERIHRIRGEHPDPTAAAADYEREIRAAFGLDVRFDLVLLGMGTDGHTASLFAGTKALEERDRLVVAHHVPAVGSWRLTMTLPALNGARTVMFVVAGLDKAAALASVLAERGDSPLPAARVRPSSGELLCFADRAALSQVDERGDRA